MRERSEAAWEMRAKSMVSCTEAAASMPQPGGAAGHDVAVVAENGQGVGGHGAGRDMENRREKLAGDFEHVRDHEEQSLGSGKGGAERAGLQRAVDRADGAAFALHLDNRGDGAPDIAFALRGPLVAPLGNRRGRGDGINGHHFVEPVGNVGGGFVAVQGLELVPF